MIKCFTILVVVYFVTYSVRCLSGYLANLTEGMKYIISRNDDKTENRPSACCVHKGGNFCFCAAGVT